MTVNHLEHYCLRYHCDGQVTMRRIFLEVICVFQGSTIFIAKSLNHYCGLDRSPFPGVYSLYSKVSQPLLWAGSQSVSRGVQSLQQSLSTIIVGWFVARTREDHNTCYIQPPKLFVICVGPFCILSYDGFIACVQSEFSTECGLVLCLSVSIILYFP